MLGTTILAGAGIGVIGMAVKEIYRTFNPKEEVIDNFKDMPDDCLWQEIWYYNKVSVKLEGEKESFIETPFLLGKCKTSTGARFLFKLPIGITTKKMETCRNEIQEKFNAYDVIIKHYKDDMAVVELVTTVPHSQVAFCGSIKNDDWNKLWDATSIKTGDASSGYSYPVLSEEQHTEFGKDFTFQLPVGLSTFKVNKVDITIKEFLSARDVKILALEGNKMRISAVYQELPSVVNYEYIERESRDELEIVIGRCLNGWKRLKLLSGTHNLLVAGAIGSGKSVAVNSMLIDLGITYPPSELEMYIADLKVVELSQFKRMKHVKQYVDRVEDLCDMIDELTDIMWQRYDMFDELAVKKLSSFNEKVDKEKQLPYILFIIEEIPEFSTHDYVKKGGYQQKLANLLSKSRGAGIGCICTCQRGTDEFIPRKVRAQLCNRLLFSVADENESKIFTDGKYDLSQLRGNGHGVLLDKDKEEFQGFWINEDKGEITQLMKKHNIYRERGGNI